MINLYVDDKRECPPGWVVARTVTEAIRILDTQDVAVVSLDHDIQLRFDVEIPSRRGVKEIPVEIASPETFEPVARYLALIPEDERPQIQFHTANPAGEAAMRAILGE